MRLSFRSQVSYFGLGEAQYWSAQKLGGGDAPGGAPSADVSPSVGGEGVGEGQNWSPQK
jgi:hypothetical protein